MADIIDVIHRFSYEITGQDKIKAVEQQFTAQAASIARNTQSIQRLNAALAASSNPQQQERIRQAIQNRTNAINEQGRAIQNTIINDRQFQQTLRQEIGIINELNQRLNTLRTARNRATSSQEVQGYNRQIAQIEAEQRRFTSPGGSRLGGIGNSILQGFGIGVGMQVLDTAISKISELTQEAGRFAAEIEGVRPAFEALNRPQLLDELRTATKGTISDLELMKQAVQYNNLGLPLERMAQALQFARIRARETGQSVDFLVQSIVNGIGRQSVLILDNLGISASKVREEITKTGDFGEAAFKIIEEAIKASNDELTTFQERQLQLQATLANQQAAWGDYFNFVKSGLQAVLIDVVSFNGYQESNTKAVLDGLKLREEARNRDQEKQAYQNFVFQRDFEKYLDNLATLDLNGRSERLKQAENFYNADIANAKNYYGASTDAFNSYVRGQEAAYNRFLGLFKKSPINLQNITASNITTATQAQLQEALDLLQGQKTNLGGNQTSDINSINQRIQVLQNRLKVFDAPSTSSRSSSSNKDPYQLAQDSNKQAADAAKYADEQLQIIEQQRQNLAQLIIQKVEENNISKEGLKYLQGQVNEEKELLSLREQRRNVELEMDAVNQQLITAQNFNRQADIKRLNDQFSNLQTRDLELTAAVDIKIKEIEGIELTTPAQQDLNRLVQEEIQKAANNSLGQAGRARASVNPQADNPLNTGDRDLFSTDSLKQNIYDSINLYEMLAQSAQQAYASIADAKQQQLSKEISYQQYAVQQAQILAERGNTEALKLEEDRLKELEKQQRESAQRAQVVNSALTLSYSIAAIARAALEGGGYASIATVAAVIAALGAGYAFVQSFSQNANQGFAEGVIDLKGPGTTKSDSIQARLSRGESVMTAEATAKYKPILEQMQALNYPINGKFFYPLSPKEASSNSGFASSREVNKLGKKLDGVIGAIKDYMPVNVSQKVDGAGVAQMVERNMKAEQRRWS